MISTELDLYKSTIKNMLYQSAANITQWREKFMIEVLYLYLLIPGRINFLQFGRYSRFGEQRFRQQFSRFFDWFGFNKGLAQRHTGIRTAIAFDPSYLSKSGKSTPYLGKFWSGCAGAVKRGLEISGFGLIDIDLKTCFHLEAVQTPPTNTLTQVCQTLIDWYLYIFKERSVKLLELSCYVVADAYFSKKNFVDGIVSMGFHLVSRLRDDASLMYLTERQPSGKRGRPRKYDGKIQLEKPDESRFKTFSLEPGQGSLLYAIVYSKALARNIGLCIWKSEDDKTRKLFFSTDIQMRARDIWEYYRCRFQIEFCYRDAKQFTGLCHAQSRELKKLNFHFNASMTAVNIAKSIAMNRGQTLSMASTKVLLHNSFLLERFITVSGISPNQVLNQRLWEEVVCFAARAA